jgi:hypothetical protein
MEGSRPLLCCYFLVFPGFALDEIAAAFFFAGERNASWGPRLQLAMSKPPTCQHNVET